jgi:hypothetical protein
MFFPPFHCFLTFFRFSQEVHFENDENVVPFYPMDAVD